LESELTKHYLIADEQVYFPGIEDFPTMCGIDRDRDIEVKIDQVFPKQVANLGIIVYDQDMRRFNCQGIFLAPRKN